MSDYWLWQHEYRKRWITYSEEESQVLNQAVDNKELTVSLPNKNSSKVIIVDFKKMVQKNKKTLYEQRVRCLVSSSDFHLWLWKDSNDEWCSFKPNLAALLELAYLNGDKLSTFYDDGDFEGNIERWELINKNTREVSPIKREKVDISTTLNVKNIQEMSSSELASLQVTKPSNKRKLTNNGTGDSTKTSSVTANSEDEEINAFSASAGTIAPVDSECPEKESFHVCTVGGVIFSATLNQTNLQNNNNKYYIIQLLENNHKKQFAVWKRWGRVGNKGQNDMAKFGSSFEEAKTSFEKKFHEKTKNHWSDIKSFTKVKGKYDLLHMDLNNSAEPVEKKMKKLDVKSKLPEVLQELMKMICNKTQMEDAMREMSYDSNKMPLGKLTMKQIKDGYVALDKISDILKAGKKAWATKVNMGLIDACNEFYTKIPHNFGMKTPPLIKDQFDLDVKINMLEALSNITVAMGVLDDSVSSIEHPLDRYYRSLNCSLELLNIDCPEYNEFQKCLLSTHGSTHSAYKMEIVHLFKCHKEREESEYKDFGDRFLLWHGSRFTNWLGILKEGLRIAPPEAPATGYMFGKGIYFADVSSKSANYCYATKKNNRGFMLLCEVSVGKQHVLYESDSDLPSTLPRGYNSVKGTGRFSPSEYKSGVLSSKAKASFGPLIENQDHEGSLQYNEYIVYDVRQVQMKYLAEIKFNFD